MLQLSFSGKKFFLSLRFYTLPALDFEDFASSASKSNSIGMSSFFGSVGGVEEAGEEFGDAEPPTVNNSSYVVRIT